MNTTTCPTYIPPIIAVRVVNDLASPAELNYRTNGEVRLDLSPHGAYPGNLPYVLRWVADQLERNLRPDASGYLVRRLTLVPTPQDGQR